MYNKYMLIESNSVFCEDQQICNEVFEAKSKIDFIASLCYKDIKFINSLLLANESLMKIINNDHQWIQNMHNYDSDYEDEIRQIVRNLHNETQIQIRRIFLYINSSFLNPQLRHYKYIINDVELNYDKYKIEIENAINKATEEILDIIKNELEKLNQNLIKKYTTNLIIRKNNQTL